MIDYTKALSAVRFIRARSVARDNPEGAAAWIAGQNFRGSDALLELVTRSGVSNADDADLRGRNPVLTDLGMTVRNASILGRLPGVRRLPFQSATIALGGAVRAHWVRQGVAVPASSITFGEPQLLDDRTVGALLIAGDRFLAEASPMAELALAEELVTATADALDSALVDMANDGTGEAPASVTYTGYSTASTGSTLAQTDTDLRGLIEELIDAGADMSTAAWVLHPRSALYLASLRGTGGAPAHPLLGANGGTLLGLPALVSAGVPIDDDTAALTQLSLISGSGIVVAGADQIELRTSKQASVEMDTSPTGDAGTPTAASAHMVSMFQANCTAMMTLSHANWRARRATVAATLTSVAY